MKTLPVAFGIIGLLLANVSISQVKTRNYIYDPRLAPREHNVDFKHMRLEIELEPTKGLVKGKVTHFFTPLLPNVDSIYLDAVKMRIKEIYLNGKSSKYKQDSLGVTVYAASSLSWNTNDSLTIVYEVNPKKGLYFVGWNDAKNLSRKQVWSQGQGIDNRCWIPMYDEMNDKMTTELLVKFDKDYKVLSNGKLIETKSNNDGTNTWHYKMSHPHAPYLVMLGIGKYDIKETASKSGVPMLLYYYPEWKNRVETTYKYSEQMVDFFEKEIGVPYAWEGYAQLPVQDYMFGAMENTTATVFGDFFMVDERSFLDRNYVGVNAHELAHQWFGDLVTARSDAHHWLQESFATYYNQLFEREVFGQDYFDWTRRNAQATALDESIKNKLPVANSDAGTARHYPKGAFVLNMLKYVVGGAEVYNKAIKYYLEMHKYQNVDSHDLLTAFEETTGMQLEWFWDEWIYRGGEPSYQINYQEVNNATEITIKQIQDLDDITGLPSQGLNDGYTSYDPFVSSVASTENLQSGLFKMPIWLEVHYTDGTSDKKRFWIEQQTEIVKLGNPMHKKIDFVLFDPNNEVMKKASFTKSDDMLLAQAAKAKHMLDRYDALFALRNVNIDKKRDFLIDLFNKETYHYTKSEIIFQLVSDKNSKSIDLLKKAINDKDVLVRKAALKYGDVTSPELNAEFEKLLKDPSYDITDNALQKLSNANPSKTATYLETTKGIEGNVGRNVIVKWNEIAYTSTNDTKYGNQLVDYASNSFEFRTRSNAMQALKRCNYFNEQLLINSIDALLSSNSRLSGPANEMIKYFYSQNNYKKIISGYLNSKKWSDWERKIIEPFTK